jgi:hypothetical protein
MTERIVAGKHVLEFGVTQTKQYLSAPGRSRQ